MACGIKVQRYDAVESRVVWDEYPDAEFFIVDDDSKVLEVCIQDVYVGDKDFTDDLVLAVYAENSWIMAKPMETPKYETRIQRNEREMKEERKKS